MIATKNQMFAPQNPLVKNSFAKTVRMAVLEIVVTSAQDLEPKNSLAKVLVRFANAMVIQKNVQLIQMGILSARTVNMVLLEIRFEYFKPIISLIVTSGMFKMNRARLNLFSVNSVLLIIITCTVMSRKPVKHVIALKMDHVTLNVQSMANVIAVLVSAVSNAKKSTRNCCFGTMLLKIKSTH